MDIVINIAPLMKFISLPAGEMFLRIFFEIGWLPLFLLYLYGARVLWLYYIQTKWGGRQKYVFLAIDIPRGNLQSPKAVENIFSYLAGAHMSINIFERWWLGEWQVRFSLEVVSIEGYIQYVIRSPLKYRDLTEAAIYSQYPDAEITEINDYTREAPATFPNEKWDLHGGEFTYTHPMAYPIKTYRQFEIQNPGEKEPVFKDPNASLMALMSSIGPGEQLWYQILIQPLGFDWMNIAEDEVKKIFGEAVNDKKGPLEAIGDIILQLLHDFSEQIYRLWSDIPAEEKKKEEKRPKTMIELNPMEKKKVEALQEKVSKVAFNTKIRYIYLARKEIFKTSRNKAFSGFVGYMKQFIDNDLNSLRPDMELTITRAHYFLVNYRRDSKKRSIMRGYRGRDGVIGKLPIIMNIEELATLWHFPVEASVKAPLLQKAPGRKAEAPMSLPVTTEAGNEELTEFLEDIKGTPLGGKTSVPDSTGAREGKQTEDRRPDGSSDQTKPGNAGNVPENLPFA